MDYIELEIKVEPKQPASDLFITQLAEAGFESFLDTEQGFMAYIPAAQFDQHSTEQALKNEMEGLIFHVEKRIIADRNWNTEWESNFQPVEIEGKLRIRAPFHVTDPAFPLELVIQPQQSFGTGHHQTTRLMIEKLLTTPLEARYILDMGCGTGILGILCSRLGTDACIGVDIEENAAMNASENVTLNAVQRMEIRLGDEKAVSGLQFDVILANINKNILRSAMPAYATLAKKNADILLSGFFTTDIDEIVACGRLAGFELKGTNSCEEWALVHLTKL